MTQPGELTDSGRSGRACGEEGSTKAQKQIPGSARRRPAPAVVQVRVRWTFAEGEGLFTVLEPLSDEARRAELEFLIRLGHAVRSGTFAPFAAGAAGVSPAPVAAPSVAPAPASPRAVAAPSAPAVAPTPAAAPSAWDRIRHFWLR